MLSRHVPVLINQALNFLNPSPGKVFIDCTLGLGGHAGAVLQKLDGQGSLYGIEADARNLDKAKEFLNGYSNVHYLHDNFENLGEIAEMILKKEGRIDGILFDFGLSSLHVDEADRGFSFQKEGPLDMRYDARNGPTAADIVNAYPPEKLFFIFKTYGQEKFSYRIAQKIFEYRKHRRFETTTQLADFIKSVVPPAARYARIHPATRIFQALRITANREIEAIEAAIPAAVGVLSPGGRIVVISYHSLEDRFVKHYFREQQTQGVITVLTKRPVIPEEEEQESNKRSRSAKLRAAEKM